MSDLDLLRFCIGHMCSKEHIHHIFSEKNIKFSSSDSYVKLSECITKENCSLFPIEEFAQYSRSIWKSTDLDFHINNLKSGKLNSNNWHGAMPSMLHLSMQNKVRDCINGIIDLDELINIGADIMKHEYFMVAAHDLAEAKLIHHFKSTIPPSRQKSISDFIFNGIPYDLKNTNPILGFTKKKIDKNKKGVIASLLEGADVSRIRQQAKSTINNWGLNRFYFIVQDQKRWLTEPEVILEELVFEANNLKVPILIIVDGIKIYCQLICI